MRHQRARTGPLPRNERVLGVARPARGGRRVAGRIVALVALAAAGAPAPSRAAEAPAVARPRFEVDRRALGGGTVFFLPASDEVGAAAVGTAHSYRLDQLAQAGEVSFVLGHSLLEVSVSSRLLAKPGRSYQEAGSSMLEDFLIFALDRKPNDIRVLEADPRGTPEVGERVRIIGVPAVIPRDDDDIFGTVVAVGDTQVEIDLDVPEDLRGWGGGPILSTGSERVVGMLQAARPLKDEGTLRVTATPIAPIARALETPLDAGRGRPFSAFAPGAAEPTAGQPARESSPAIPATSRAPGSGPLLGSSIRKTGDLNLHVDYPADGAVIGDAAGAFLAGSALAPLGEFRSIDVVFVIDTSQSTENPTGADINGNGIVGENRLGGVGALFGVGSTDPGDSILAAEVMAARQFLHGLDPRSTRISLVTFSGEADGRRGGGGGLFGGRVMPPAVTEVALTKIYDEVERGLDRVLKRGPAGMTHMAAGVDQATIELLGLSGGMSEPNRQSDKFVIFLTDGAPTLPYEGFKRENVRAVIRAAKRAAAARIQIHSFAVGGSALETPVAAVEMARRTDGVFTPVRHPADLPEVIEQVRFVDLEAIEIRNQTTGGVAAHLITNPDGSWSALLGLQPGENQILVEARASDGTHAERELTLHYAPGATDPYVPRELVAARNRLLERRLVELRRDRLAAERADAERTRRELQLEIDRERAEAQERAEQQRKELELEAEPESEGRVR